MRVSERHQRISVAKTELEILIGEYLDRKDLEYADAMRELAAEYQRITLELEPSDESLGLETELSVRIHTHQKLNEMTTIEVLQALTSLMASYLNFMLRYERHGNYDKPAGLE